ncbi:MAG: flagellar basal body rod protein FlgC [Gammaproteobacteria bacterium]|nr:flagellar basal body rod protein FlgC [Gammaproteobacteria bacterium]
MSLFSVFNIAGSALSAENVRLNTTASNLANAQSVSSTEADTYRARQPVFSSILQAQAGTGAKTPGVQVQAIVEDQSQPIRKYSPGHPLADQDGYIYMPNVNPVEEMANMISASRSYQNNVQVMESAKQLMQMTLHLGE